MSSFDVTQHGPVIAELLQKDRLPALGPGIPDMKAGIVLKGLSPEKLLSPHMIRDKDMSRLCLSGLWLHFDHLDEAHTICQDVGTTSGSYWHAVMHRREPDAWNSKYWWRRVGDHPVLAKLREQATTLRYDYTNPFDFVDYCERVRGSGKEEENLAMRVQRLEWELLFDWCFLAAIG